MQHFFENNFRPYFVIAYKSDTDTLCDKDGNETNLIYKAKRFETKNAAEDYLKNLISRKTEGEKVFAPNHFGVTWEREDFIILQVTKNDWEEVWQNGGNEQLRKSPESSNIIRTILDKGKSGKTLYRIIDNKDRLYSDEKERIVDLRITCTTSSKESLLVIAASLNRDAKAIVEFSSDTIAYEMKRTNSIFTEEFEHLLFGKFKVIHQEKPIVLKDDNGQLHELEHFKAYPLDQSGEFAKKLVKKRVSHYNDDKNDTLNNKRRVSNLLYKKTKIDEGIKFMNLFERILQEADKSRFLKPLYDEYKNLYGAIPEYDSLLKFVNNDPLMNGFDWQSVAKNLKANDDTYCMQDFDAILSRYRRRLEIRDSQSEKKKVYHEDNIIEKAKAAGLRICEQGTEANYSYDFVHLVDLDNEKFTFMAPMTYDACIFCDSVGAGGEGAKWCLGYTQSDSYWKSYVEYHNLFIFAFNNEAYRQGDNRKTDTLKYMIQLNLYAKQTQVWLQSDEEDETIPIGKFKRLFGHTAFEMLRVFVNNILIYDNIYSAHSADLFYDKENNKVIIPWGSGYEIDETFYIDEFYNGDYDIYNKQIDQETGLSFGSMAKQAVYDKGYNSVEIECDNEKVHPNKMHIDSQQFKEDTFDISLFCNWLKECGVTNAQYITIKNGKFNKVIWEPEASNNITNIYFENCEVKHLTYLNFSDEEHIISFDSDCRIDTLYWAFPFDQMNTDNLDCDSDAIRHEEFYDEEIDEDVNDKV